MILKYPNKDHYWSTLGPTPPHPLKGNWSPKLSSSYLQDSSRKKNLAIFYGLLTCWGARPPTHPPARTHARTWTPRVIFLRWHSCITTWEKKRNINLLCIYRSYWRLEDTSGNRPTEALQKNDPVKLAVKVDTVEGKVMERRVLFAKLLLKLTSTVIRPSVLLWTSSNVSAPTDTHLGK